jgi:hypothetical protein
VRQDTSINEDPEWDVEFYADDNGREPCREWAERLSPQKRAAFIATIRLVLACRGLDVVKTEYGKALVFSTAGRKIILLLSGYDKARHSSDRWQQRQIAEARRYLASYRERQRRIK